MGNSPQDMINDLNELQQCVSRLVDDIRLHQTGRLSGGIWCPPADVYEADDAVVIEVEIPDVPLEDIDISVRQNMLTIRGERRMLRNSETDQYHRLERSYGTFCRVFSLPLIPDAAQVSARYADGLLIVSIAKGESDIRRIPVK